MKKDNIKVARAKAVKIAERNQEKAFVLTDGESYFGVDLLTTLVDLRGRETVETIEPEINLK